MSYRELSLRAELPEGAVTELMYEIASCRADGVDVLRINVASELPEIKKILSSSYKTLKAMKQKGTIQFYATKDSFDLMRTEAVFLQNKYPDLFSEIICNENQIYIFVKI